MKAIYPKTTSPMRVLKIFLAGVSLCGLLGWAWLRKPYSPTDDLEPVSYTAFEVSVPNVEAGFCLAEAVGQWPGVTATAYNPNSGLLAVSHTAIATEQWLMVKLALHTGSPVHKREFVEASGPQCPVPHEFLAYLPQASLVMGLFSAALLALLLSAPPKATAPFVS